MKKNIYIIIGEGGCGKSSIVRALTGTYQSSRMDVQLINGIVIDIAIWPRSAQEGTLETAVEVLQKITDMAATHALIVLRPWKAQEYIDLLITQHNIIQVLFISANLKLPRVNTPVIPNEITNSKSRPINANAQLIRNLWGWS